MPGRFDDDAVPILEVVFSAVDHDAFRDVVLAQAPEFSASRAKADADIERGVLGEPMDDVFAELDAEGERPSR